MDLLELHKNKIKYNYDLITIKVFRDLYERDKSEDKSKFIKELIFIYWNVHPNSKGVKQGYKGKQLFQIALENSGLKEEDIDDKIKDAINWYKKNIYGVNTKILINIYKSFNVTSKLIEKLTEKNTEILKAENITSDSINEALKNSMHLIDLSTTIPKKIKDIEVALDNSKKELKNKKVGRGGTIITESMIPDE